MTTYPQFSGDGDPRRAGDRGSVRRVHSTEFSPLLKLVNASGRRWFLLGAMLLIIMGLAVWAAHRDPLAISGLFFAIAAILRTVPKIIEESARCLREIQGQDTGQARDDPEHETTATAEPAPTT